MNLGTGYMTQTTKPHIRRSRAEPGWICYALDAHGRRIWGNGSTPEAAHLAFSFRREITPCPTSPHR